MTRQNALLILACHNQPEERWSQIAYAGLLDERWSETDVEAFEGLTRHERHNLVVGHMNEIPTVRIETPRDRRQRSERENRLRQRRHVVGIRYVRRHALDPFVDARLSSGARITLVYLIARCGKGRHFAKRSCLVATDLGISKRTVQTHYVALEATGYIARSSPCSRTGETTIVLTNLVEPPAFAKKPAVVDAVSADHGAQESAPTQPIKGSKIRKKEEDGDSSGIPKAVSEEPVAVLAERASPPALPLGDVLVEAVRHTRLTKGDDRNQQGFRPSASDPRKIVGLTPFDQHMKSVLAKVLGGGTMGGARDPSRGPTNAGAACPTGQRGRTGYLDVSRASRPGERSSYQGRQQGSGSPGA